MPWFKVDDTLASHPKARTAGLPAMGLWVVAGAYSSQYLTEGFVPEWYVNSWPSGRKLAAALVDAQLWSVTEGGWLFHQWDERQPTKEQVEAERAATRERQRRYREARRDVGVSDGSSNGVTNTALSRPDPTNKKPATPDGFADFWASYPKRVGKGQAIRAWNAALKRGTAAEHITAAAQKFAAGCAGKDPKFIPHPSTWLNGQRYDDEPETNDHRHETAVEWSVRTGAPEAWA